MDGFVAVSPPAAPWVRPYRAVEWVSGPQDSEVAAIARSRVGADLLEAGVNSCLVLAEVTAIVAGSWAAQSLLMPPTDLGDHGPSVADLEASFLTPEAVEDLDLGDELGHAIAAEWAQWSAPTQAPTATTTPTAQGRNRDRPVPHRPENPGQAVAAPEWMPIP